MTEEGFVHNVRLDNHFTSTYNKTPQDPRLSWGAKGLLWYILSREPGWKVKTWHLAQIFQGKGRGNGKPAIKGFIAELRESEYILYCKNRDDKGRWTHNYHVYPMPYPEYQKMFPGSVKPTLVQPTLVKPPIILSKELDQGISKKLLPTTDTPIKKAVVVPSICAEMGGDQDSYERLRKEYSKAQIIQACELAKSQGSEVLNFYGWMRDCIAKSYKPAPNKEHQVAANKRILKDSFGGLHGKKTGLTPVHVGPTYIEFTNTGCGPSKVFDVTDSNFEDKVRAHIKKLQELHKSSPRA